MPTIIGSRRKERKGVKRRASRVVKMRIPRKLSDDYDPRDATITPINKGVYRICLIDNADPESRFLSAGKECYKARLIGVRTGLKWEDVEKLKENEDIYPFIVSNPYDFLIGYGRKPDYVIDTEKGIAWLFKSIK